MIPGDRPDGFRSLDAVTVTGVTYRQLNYWDQIDLLVPAISEANGSGTQRRYSYNDLIQLKVIKLLLDAGFSLASARRAVKCLSGNLTREDVSSSNLVFTTVDSVLARSGAELIDVLRGGQGILSLVPMTAVIAELDFDIMTLNNSGRKRWQ
jgi:DNA-binding transcriptional MerR regulator